MGAIKVTPADGWFSKCVRERVNWTCERCGKQYPEGHRQGLHCSHHHRRGNWGIRFDPMNAESLCYGCHSHEGGTQGRINACLTDAEQEILTDKKNDTGLGKLVRKTKGKGDIAKHYKAELERMRSLRAEGVTGRIEFDNYV